MAVYHVGHCAADVGGGDNSAYCLYGFLTFLIYFVIFQLRTLTVKYSVLLVNRHMLVTHETDGIVLSENYIIYIQVCLLFHIKSSTFICMCVLFLQKKKTEETCIYITSTMLNVFICYVVQEFHKRQTLNTVE